MIDTVNNLATALQRLKNPDESTLKTINIGYNGIGDQGAVALANAITVTKAPIQWIGLEGNGIGDQGATAIENALHYNDTITYLGIKYNNVSKSKMDSILKLCENTVERRAAVKEWREKYPIIVEPEVNPVTDDEEVDMSCIYLTVEI